MLKFISRIAPVAVMALVAVGFAHFTRADDATPPSTEPAATTGSIVVTVNTEDGKPAVGADVKLFAAHGHAKKPKNEDADSGSDAGTDAPKPKKPMMGPPLKTGTTDDKGMFTFTDIPMGNYSVAAELKDSGRGRAKVVLNADSVSVTITLKAPAPKPDAGSSSQPAPSN